MTTAMMTEYAPGDDVNVPVSSGKSPSPNPSPNGATGRGEGGAYAVVNE